MWQTYVRISRDWGSHFAVAGRLIDGFMDWVVDNDENRRGSYQANLHFNPQIKYDLGKALHLGISQISAGSCTGVGGYHMDIGKEEIEAQGQFQVEDHRTTDEMLNNVCRSGYLPSFCTACYREGRTGDRFMALCKNMQILNCCHPNALMTLKEYLEDYASEETKKIGMELIDRELEKIPNPKVKQTAYEHIHDIAEGKRDFRF